MKKKSERPPGPKGNSRQEIQQEFSFSQINEDEKKKALHYGEIEIIPGVVGDCYILADGSAVMSERGFADLLGMDHMTLRSMEGNWPPKTLESFCRKGLTIMTTLATVEAENCPYKGRGIRVYNTQIMEEIIRVYALAYAGDALRKNQIHIGKRCATLVQPLVIASFHIRIEWACGLQPQIQKTIQRYHKDCIYERANDMLYTSLHVVYPDREEELYGKLMSTCFRYNYEHFFGREWYKKVQQIRKSHPVHQYIEHDEARLCCVCYITFLANYIVQEQCRIPEAKQPVQEAM